MIRDCTGDLLQDDAQALVNPVNCQGTMGKGLAAAFARAYPRVDLNYMLRCGSRLVRPGSMDVHPIDGRYVINFPTKDRYSNPANLGYITHGLVDLTHWISRLQIRTIAIPALGCGEGGLAWPIVRAEIYQALEPIPDLDVRLYAPQEDPHGSPLL